MFSEVNYSRYNVEGPYKLIAAPHRASEPAPKNQHTRTAQQAAVSSTVPFHFNFVTIISPIGHREKIGKEKDIGELTYEKFVRKNRGNNESR